jgi:4-amino-4-deoxy-L-arabinose transferase-like glycosyltransferase
MNQASIATSISDIEIVEQSKTRRTVWPYFAAATVAVIVIAAVRWSLVHPYGVDWDETGYLNEIQIDGQRLRTGRLVNLVGRILLKSFGRPPAYRVLALPFVGLFGYHTAEVRLVSLACFALSVWFVYLATRRVSSPVAGALAALIFALSPEVVSASIIYATDSSLYLATAAMLYYVFSYWRDGDAGATTWIGLGLAIGLGFLSKASFLPVFFPLVAFWFFASRWRRLGVPGLAAQGKAFALALLIAGPWWALNLKSAFGYGQYARNAIRNSLGHASLATWACWMQTVLECLLGPAISILIGAVLVACLVGLVRRRKMVLDRVQLAVIGACLCAGLPMVVMQLSGTNHLMRYLTPSVMTLAIGLGVLAESSGWTRSRAALSFATVLAFVQLAMLVAPVVHPNKEPAGFDFANGVLPWRVMSTFDQWDWQPVRALSDQCGVELPTISYLGNERAFNLPQIQYAWIARSTSTGAAESSVPVVKWLWRYDEGGPFDLPKVVDAAEQSDIVITTPHYLGTVEDNDILDNQYNAEFAQRLSQDPLFQGPFHFEMGRFEPIDAEVFVKKSLACHSQDSQ